MRKIAICLLCFCLLFSLCACEFSDFIKHFENLQTHSTEHAPTDYGTLIGVYRDVLYVCQQYDGGKGTAGEEIAKELGIFERCDKELYNKLFLAAYLQYPGRWQEDWRSPHYKLSCGYAIKDLNADGVEELILLQSDYTIVAVFSAPKGKPELLGDYQPRHSCWIDAEGLLHESGSNGADSHKYAVYRIAPGGQSKELIVEFGTMGHEWEGNVAVQKYYKLQDDLAMNITEQEYAELADRWIGAYDRQGADATQYSAGLTFTPLFDENQIVKEMFDAAVQNQIYVYDVAKDESGYLMHCRFPYDQKTLADSMLTGVGVCDLDGDGTDEYIISSSMEDVMVLRYHGGRMYCYAYLFSSMRDLKIDGTFAWHNQGDNFEYGVSRLCFDGATPGAKELYRITNDGEPDAAYYVQGEQVTKAELGAYVQDLCTQPLQFVPMKVNWISSEQAKQIAVDYWERTHGIDTQQCVIAVTLIYDGSYCVQLTSDEHEDTVFVDSLSGRIVQGK